MRSLFLRALVVLVILAVSYALLQRSEGYVLITVAGYAFEMTFAIAVLLNVIFFIACYLAWQLIRSLLLSRRAVKGWATNRRMRRGQNRTTLGLIAFIEGRWDHAAKLLAKAANSSSTPLINYLFAARASSAIGDSKGVDSFLKQAELSATDADVAIGLTQAELQIQKGQYEQALASLLRIKKHAGAHSAVASALALVYEKLNDWSALLKFTASLTDGVLSEDRLAAYQQRACCEMLKAAGKSKGASLSECWRQLPNSAKKRAPVVKCYAEQLIASGWMNDADAALRSQILREYNSELVRLYGRVVLDDTLKQLGFVEKLQKNHADDDSLLLTLAVFHRRLGSLEQAKAYIEQSIAVAPRPIAYAALADIYAQEGSFEKSTALLLKSYAL